MASEQLADRERRRDCFPLIHPSSTDVYDRRHPCGLGWAHVRVGARCRPMSVDEDDLSEPSAPRSAGLRHRLFWVLSLAYAVAVVGLVAQRTGVYASDASADEDPAVVFTATGNSDPSTYAAIAQTSAERGAAFHLSLGDLASPKNLP